jgi:hypothetical protein
MVTRRETRRRHGGGVRPWAAAAVLAALLCWSGAARAAESSLVFVTVKRGVQDASGSGDTLFARLQQDHGAPQDDRAVETTGIELDLYSIAGKSYGVAVGMEVLQYDKLFHFSDPAGALTAETLRLEARGALYSLKGFLRWGVVLPFVALGGGNYYVTYMQSQEGLRFIDSATQVFHTRAGVRLMMGRFGMLFESGQVTAPLRVHTAGGNSTLELGGSFANVGFSWLW